MLRSSPLSPNRFTATFFDSRKLIISHSYIAVHPQDYIFRLQLHEHVWRESRKSVRDNTRTTFSDFEALTRFFILTRDGFFLGTPPWMAGKRSVKTSMMKLPKSTPLPPLPDLWRNHSLQIQPPSRKARRFGFLPRYTDQGARHA